MNTTLLGIGTAVPENRMTQDEALVMFQDIVCEDERQKRLSRVLYRKSNVRNRHVVVPYTAAYVWADPDGPAEVPANSDSYRLSVDQLPEICAGQSAGPTTGKRMELYAQYASELALSSAQGALDNADTAATDITHLVTVSCTGFVSPGVDIDLINGLGLPSTTQRVNVGFMGCHGAINGLRTALAISKSDPQSRVLVCAVELCSLHYRFQWDNEGIIGNALFADGSASLVIGQDSSAAGGTNGWELVATGSVLIPESRDTMSWEVGDHGFEMMLTSEVGDRIEENLKTWLTEWLAGHQLTFDDIEGWGVHPGGPRILQAVQNSLGLQDEDLATSHSILERYGNMSSPTVIFILEAFQSQLSQPAAGKTSHCLLLAFGPGLMAEIALLRRSHVSP
jgi:predicted naringenin-chalcone synthase